MKKENLALKFYKNKTSATVITGMSQNVYSAQQIPQTTFSQSTKKRKFSEKLIKFYISLLYYI